MGKNFKYIVLGAAIVTVGAFFYFKLFISKVRRQIVFQAKAEAKKWQPYDELDVETAKIIQQYWRDGVGLNFTTEQILDPNFQNTWAWSAAFVSWVVKASGGDTFPVHQTHAHYIIKTTENRKNNTGDFKAYSTDEAKPQIGDIVCRRRGSSDATYDNVVAGDTLHCDIVTDVNNSNIEVVGGNLNNKVKQTELSLNDKGYISDRDYFVIIKGK